LAKYDADGNQEWIRDPRVVDLGSTIAEVSADQLGNVYYFGVSDDAHAYLSKYDAQGSLLWNRTLTTLPGLTAGVSANDLGVVYVCGYRNGDGYVAKLNADGDLLWTQQISTPEADYVEAVTAYGSNTVYVSGYTRGNLGGPNAGGDDIFIAKFNDLPVPEPTSATLGLLALACFVMHRTATRGGRGRAYIRSTT
jgi:hypothetical protein